MSGFSAKRIHWKLGLALGLALVGSSVLANESCQRIDYNSDPNSALRKIPVYDQAETGICYAYAAAQMIDYYRFSHGEPSTELTNPVYAAYATSASGMAKQAAGKNRAGADSLYGGFPEDVIAALRQKGSCPNSEVQKDLAGFKADLGVSDAQVLAFLEDTHKTIDQSPKDSTGRLLLSTPNDALAHAQKAIPSLGTCELDQMALESSLRGYLGLSAKAVFDDAFKTCQAALKPVNVPLTETVEAGSDSYVQSKLDQALNGNPVSIGVCSKFFDQPHYQGLNGLMPPYARRAENNVKGDCGGHGVMVTGRRESGGRCQYLIRNSWGTSWRAPGAASCACIDGTGRYWEDCKQAEENVREYVGCWFDGDAMIQNTTEVTLFK